MADWNEFWRGMGRGIGVGPDAPDWGNFLPQLADNPLSRFVADNPSINPNSLVGTGPRQAYDRRQAERAAAEEAARVARRAPAANPLAVEAPVQAAPVNAGVFDAVSLLANPLANYGMNAMPRGERPTIGVGTGRTADESVAALLAQRPQQQGAPARTGQGLQILPEETARAQMLLNGNQAQQNPQARQAPTNPLTDNLARMNAHYDRLEQALPYAGSEQAVAAILGAMTNTQQLIQAHHRDEMQFSPDRESQRDFTNFVISIRRDNENIPMSVIERMATEAGIRVPRRAASPLADSLPAANNGANRQATETPEEIQYRLYNLAHPRIPGRTGSERGSVPLAAFVQTVPQDIMNTPHGLQTLIAFMRQNYPGGASGASFDDWWGQADSVFSSDSQDNQLRRSLREAINRQAPNSIGRERSAWDLNPFHAIPSGIMSLGGYDSTSRYNSPISPEVMRLLNPNAR